MIRYGNERQGRGLVSDWADKRMGVGVGRMRDKFLGPLSVRAQGALSKVWLDLLAWISGLWVLRFLQRIDSTLPYPMPQFPHL